MHDAHAGEVGVLEAWDSPEYTPLLAPLQARREADRLHGPEAEGVFSAPGYGLDRETALEVQVLLEILYGAELGGSQVLYEGVVLLFGHRAVQVCRLTLAVA